MISVIDQDSFASKRRERDRVRRVEAVSLLMAGLTYEQIGDRLEISEEGARQLVARTLSAATNRAAEQLRELENQRLDRAQFAIWSKVLAGDLQAIDVFLRISARRSKMNGLDEPTKVNLSINVRAEMEQALAQLEAVVLGEVIDAAPESVES